MRIHQRVEIDGDLPEASAVCDRCGAVYNLPALKWELQYYGMQLQRTGFLVCEPCFDLPQPQLRPIILPPDPEPVMNPRVFNFTDAETDYLTVQGSNDRISTQADVPLSPQENGDAMIDNILGLSD